MGRPPSSRRNRPKLAGALLSAIAFCGGCSILFHADPSQCSSNTDCAARGPAFANHVCMSGTCVAQAIVVMEGGADATADGSMKEASVEDAAEAGPPPDAGCKVKADCMALNPTHPEVACDVSTGNCLQLTTDECPFLTTAGDPSGTVHPPIFVGAFSSIPTNGPMSHPEYLNYNLVISEFTSSGGIPAGPNPGDYRMPVGVICNADGTQTQLNNALNHLISDLHVPVIVSALDTVTLAGVLQNNSIPNNVMVINAFGANSTLTVLDKNYLAWHMLGQPSDTAPAYQAFFPLMESYVRTTQNISPSQPVKIATLTATATDTGDLQRSVLQSVSWNGMSFAQNQTAGNYVNASTDSILNGTSLGSIEVGQAEQQIGALKPNVIVSFASAEFQTLISTYEFDIQPGSGSQFAGNPQPFYLLSPYNVQWPATQNWIGLPNASTSENRRTRFAGINFAASLNNSVLALYDANFQGAGNPASALGYENFYDAMYFAVYSIVAAGHVPTLMGSNLGQGMTRLVSGMTYDMGTADMGAIFGALSSQTSTVSLMGALGAPNFTLATGARIGAGSVYCFNRDSTGTPQYDTDVLTMATGDGGAPSLTGTFPCFSLCGGDAGSCTR